MTPLTPLALAACLAIAPAADQILLRDIAAAFENFAGLPPDTIIALAPAPGVERRFDISELRRMASRLHLAEPEREVCVNRPVAPIERARMLDAMRAQLPSARIELLDFSRQPAPEGVLEFPRNGLRPAPGGALWT